MKHILLSLFLLFSCFAFTQSKWNVGLVIGASSKLRLGIPHGRKDNGPTFSEPHTHIYPFEAFLNGGFSTRYHLNEKHFFQADIVMHRMDISSKTIVDYGKDFYISMFHTSYRFVQMPFTFNWIWNQKKLRPFLGIGFAPTYILDAKNISIYRTAFNGVITNEIETCNLMNFYELQGIRHFKTPLVCEVGIQPFAHTVISFRSNIGIYIHHLKNYTISPIPNNCYTGYRQNINMFSLMAKVYLRK